jgi:hypothetical protein
MCEIQFFHDVAMLHVASNVKCIIKHLFLPATLPQSSCDRWIVMIGVTDKT